LNLRDHGESHHLNKEVFNSTLIKEVGDAIKSFTSQYNFKCVYLAGFSLGANFTLRIAADRAKELGLRAAVGICPPIDPNTAMVELNKSLFIYEKYFFGRWTRSLTKKLCHFPELNFGFELAQVKNLNDVNKTFIPKFTPFQDAKAYFSSYSLVGDRLKGLEIPAYIISAEDDPILPCADLDKIPQIDNLNIELHPNGGHCGFISDLAGSSWIEGRLVQIFDES
jgi:predicted alpha/beta-fold hydrolase